MNGKAVWIGLGVTLLMALIALSGSVYSGGYLAAQIANNTKELDKSFAAIVPRPEIEANLQGIKQQISAVQADMMALKEQSERQTAEIIRRIEASNR